MNQTAETLRATRLRKRTAWVLLPALLACGAAGGGMLYILGCGVWLASGDIAETRGQEPLIVAGVAKIVSDNTLYTHPNAPPFDLMQYTPLYYYLVAYAAKAAGIAADNAEDITRLGRSVSIGAALAHLALLFLVCRRVLRVGVQWATLAAAMVLVLHAPWDFLARPDAVVSLCFLMAMALALRGLDVSASAYRTNIAFACAAVLGFVAFMAKQNGAQIVIVLLAFSLLHREWKRAAIVAALPAGLLAVTLLFGPRWFGQYYFENAVGGLNNGVRPYAAFVTTYVPVFLQLNGAALAGLAAYAVTGWLGRAATRQERFLAVALIVTFVLAAFSATKLGSAPHHYNDFLTLLVLALAYWLNSLCVASPATAARVRWAVAVFSLLYFSTQAVAFRENFVNKPWRRFSAYDEIADHIRGELRAHPGDTLLTVDYTLANFFPGRVALPQLSLSGIMYARGLVDYSAAQRMLDSGSVRWILAGPDQDIVRQLGFVGLTPRHYVHTIDTGGFAVWTYDPTADLPATPR